MKTKGSILLVVVLIGIITVIVLSIIDNPFINVIVFPFIMFVCLLYARYMLESIEKEEENNTNN